MNGRKCCFHHTLHFCLLFGGAAASAGGELNYDFGLRRSRAANGCIRLGIGQQYTRETGYGFVHGGAGEATGSRQRSGQSDLRLNSLVYQSPTLTFVQDLPNGEYLVSLASGDARYGGSASVRLNGTEVVPLTKTGAGEFVTVDSHRVKVTDGKLRVEIGGLGRLNYVTIRSSSDEPIALAGAAPSNHPGAPAQPLVPSPGDTTYYVDSSGGSDDHKGTSAQSAWKSLAKLNGIEFKAGDKILLKADCRFIGPLRSNGSGAEGKPIVIGHYGDGADPVVAGEGKVENTIRLHNQSYWEIRNLTVTNTDGGDWTDAGRAIRRAIYVTAEDVGDLEHIHLQNLEIRSVRGMYRFAGHETNGGIICQVLGKSKKTRFVDLRIENCTFHTRSIDRYPAVVTSSWKKDPACEVVWKNNTLDHAGRAHIVIPAGQWPRELVYYFDPEVGEVFPLEKMAPPVSPLTGRVGCEDIFSEMATRLKRSWSFFESTRYEKGRWLFRHAPGDKDYSLWATGAMTLGYYGELRALGFEPPWIDREAVVLDAWIGEINKHIDPKTGLVTGPGHGAPRRDPGYISHSYNWQMQNRVFMADRYTLPPGALHGGDPLPTQEAAVNSFHGKNWGNPYGSAAQMGHEMLSHRQVLRAAGKAAQDEISHGLHKLFDAKFRDGYWGAPSPDGNMKTLVVYSRMDWPIPDHKQLIDFTLSRATQRAGFAGSGCKAFNQMFSLTEARRQYPDGYRGDEVDKYTAMTFMTFLRNWDEKLDFYGGNWSGKHNNGVPLYMPHLMLDLPIMRASTVYNWREGPIFTRDKDGTIRRDQVTYQTKGFPFGG